jgi:hypothetical protein
VKYPGWKQELRRDPLAFPATREKESANDAQHQKVNRSKRGGRIRVGANKPNHNAARDGYQNHAGKYVEQAGREAAVNRSHRNPIVPHASRFVNFPAILIYGRDGPAG